ncbi:MAG: 23S rRNA (uracil(1939)-C(5))-methyltransferase RlmD, partial [Planctomycetia bacterium]
MNDETPEKGGRKRRASRPGPNFREKAADDAQSRRQPDEGRRGPPPRMGGPRPGGPMGRRPMFPRRFEAVPGRRVTLDLTDWSHGGEGVGRVDDFPILVRGASPGERVTVEIVDVHPKSAFALPIVVEKSDLERTTPACRHFGICGRCSLQHLTYAAQLHLKHVRLHELLVEAFAERDLPFGPLPILPVVGLPNAFGQRHKAHFSVQWKGREPILGHRRAHSRYVFPVEECPVHHPTATRMAKRVVEELDRIGPVDGIEKISDVVLRVSSVNGDCHITLVVAGEDATAAPDVARPAVKTMAERLASGAFPAAGVHYHRRTTYGPEVIAGATTRLAGVDRMAELVDGVAFVVSPTAFFQTSVAGAEKLVAAVLEAVDEMFAELPGARRAVLDLYSGVGLFALPLARKGFAVTAVEENAASVVDGRDSARRNQIKGVEFHAGRVDEILPLLADPASFPVVVLDPPREGCGPRVVELL